jgi:hypothetical protein
MEFVTQGNRTVREWEEIVMSRKMVYFLMFGVVFVGLTGLAMADFTGEVPQSPAAEDQISSGHAFPVVGGVADYWPEEDTGNMARERGPVETGALPEKPRDDGNVAPSMGTYETNYGNDTDSP